MRRTRARSRIALLASLALLPAIACGGSSEPADATLDAPVDAAIDAPARPPPARDGGSTLYAECASDADCGEGEGCDLSYPRGMCRSDCRADNECPGGACVLGGCVPSCVAGGAQCRGDQLCDTLCFASCSARDDATIQRCQGSMVCGRNWCAVAFDPGPMPIGSPCISDAECATRQCRTADQGAPGGMCIQAMRVPAEEAWLSPGPMPAGGCVDPYAVWPQGTAIEGDVGFCVPRCLLDADCRDGWRCDRRGHFEAPLHDDGICVPWRCGDADTGACPAGYECRPYASDGRRSVCSPAPIEG